MKMPNGKGMIGLAKERLVRAVNQVLGMVRRNGRSRKVGLALVLMVLVGGRARVRNAAETFGLDYANLLEAMGELYDAWRGWRPFQTGEGSSSWTTPWTTILRVDVSPWELLEILPHPREVREGQAPHGRHSKPRAGRSRFPLRREEDVGFVRVAEFKTEIDVARCWTCSRGTSGSHGRLRPQNCPRSL